ncbi:MAG: Nudix family hydrolase [Betaproteobacteria bacterium]|nr:Nudix family hydrolase [Betaproteobacteria bacterium]
MAAPLEVAVAVLIRADGRVLLARRPRTTVYGGYWECPGGKVEHGESIAQALERELSEELGLALGTVYPWITRVHEYPHALVRLHFNRVHDWRGEPQALEHEGLAWELPQSIGVAPLLPANGPVVRALLLPREYAISNAAALGRAEFLSRLERRLGEGLRLVQLREPGASREAIEQLAKEVLARTRAAGAKLLLNSDIDLARRLGADGAHLTSRQLRLVHTRPDLDWVGASCHGAEELRLAEDLGADFAVLGPLRPTPSHPGVEPLGWKRFAELAAGAAMPVFALGGMAPTDMEAAWRSGAHGVAMVRAAWPA